MKAIYETINHKNSAGIQYGFHTVSEKYEPLHWHDELEILYYLNGENSILIDGANYRLPKKQAVVINSGQVHNTFYSKGTAMYLCIHIDLKVMEEYIPDIYMYRIECHPENMTEEDFLKYWRICVLFERITELYIQNEEICLLEITGIIHQIFALLLQNFSKKVLIEPASRDVLSKKRIQNVIAYTEKHYMEQISLDDVAGLLGIGKEYFCRFFKKNMGISFGRYLNEIRVSKIHHDLLYTDEPVSRLIERHGFLNSKLFYDMFRSVYGCRPSQVRCDNYFSEGNG